MEQDAENNAKQESETPRPRCTCGALVFNGCFCEISLSDFLATSPNRCY